MEQAMTDVTQPEESGAVTAPNGGRERGRRQESPWTRNGGLILAGLLVLLFALLLLRSWVPVHGGVDQNGYMVGGKQLADTGSMALRLHRVDTHQIDPFQFVSPMWVGFDLGTANERFIPKYPVGLPLIYAAMLKAGGEVYGVRFVHLVSPVAMSLALLGVFLLARLVLGTRPALGVLLLLASSPVTISLTNNPNSHAVALLLVTWGMYLVISWWQGAGTGWAMLGAFLAGAAISIRYTEGLLVLPIATMALFRIQHAGWRRPRPWLQAAAVLLAWSVPLAALLWHNRVAMGTWTGYDPTHESSGFAWRYFTENWDTMLRQLYAMGLMLLFPLALAGLVTGFVWRWRLATVLALWILPSLLLYTAYYWAPEGQTVGYPRFFLTIFPPMAICAMGLLLWPVEHLASVHPGLSAGQGAGSVHRRMHLASSAAALLLLTMSVLLGIATVQQSLENDLKTRQNLQQRAEAVLEHVPVGSVLFSNGHGLLEHLQLVGNYTLYASEVFMRPMIDRLGERSPDDPAPMDPGRAHYLMELTKDKTQGELDAMRDEIILGALESGHRVFVFLQGNPGLRRPPGWRGFNRRLMVVPVMEGTDAQALSRLWPTGRPVINRNLPTTMPRAPWQLMEITLRPAPIPPTRAIPRPLYSP